MHFLTIFDRFTVDNIVDMLDFVGTHIVQLLLLRGLADSQNGLVDGRELVVLVGTG